MVFGAGATLVIAGCMASAQTLGTNLFRNLTEATYSPISDGGWLTGPGSLQGRDTDPKSIPDTDAPTLLLGSFNSADLNRDWPLFLADLDFGEQGGVPQWGVIVTAVPEPSTWTLLALGGDAAATRLLRRFRRPS